MFSNTFLLKVVEIQDFGQKINGLDDLDTFDALNFCLKHQVLPQKSSSTHIFNGFFKIICCQKVLPLTFYHTIPTFKKKALEDTAGKQAFSPFPTVFYFNQVRNCFGYI